MGHIHLCFLGRSCQTTCQAGTALAVLPRRPRPRNSHASDRPRTLSAPLRPERSPPRIAGTHRGQCCCQTYLVDMQSQLRSPPRNSAQHRILSKHSLMYRSYSGYTSRQDMTLVLPISEGNMCLVSMGRARWFPVGNSSLRGSRRRRLALTDLSRRSCCRTWVNGVASQGGITGIHGALGTLKCAAPACATSSGGGQ